MKFNPLTKKEARIIEEKGTEPAFTGEYDAVFADGLYVCRRCSAPLYFSKDKFDAHCGWPSFDDEIKDAIQRQPDQDGQRTEITCKQCGAHLGHVFVGEKLTAKNTRHCVNSLSLKFIPADFPSGTPQKAIFAGGCFWCLESTFKELQGVESVISGYTGGQTVQPTYEQVSGGTTGHAEAIAITFDSQRISYTTLLQVFFSIHDPTSLNRQGNDVGEQYRSAIFYLTLRQQEEAKSFIRHLIAEKIYEKPIVTGLEPGIIFYPAEEYHQNYYAKNPSAGYCQLVINPKLAKFRKKFQKLLK